MKIQFNIGTGEDKSKSAKITSARYTKYYFGRDVSEHPVMQLELTDGETTYGVHLPVMIIEGCTWEFSKTDSHAVTEDDQRAHWNALMERFPDYGGKREMGQESFDGFVDWLESGKATCRIIDKGVTADRNGVEHHNCTIVKPFVKDGGEFAQSRAEKKAERAAMPPPAPAKAKSTATRDDAWGAYYKSRRYVDDPQGARFNEACAEIAGHNIPDGKNEDWARCVEQFASERV